MIASDDDDECFCFLDRFNNLHGFWGELSKLNVQKKGASTLAVYYRSCILTFQSYANKITLAEASRNDFGRAVRPWRWNLSVFSLSWHAPKSQIQSQQHVTKVWTTFKQLTDSSTAPWLINERKTSERDYAAEQSTLQRRFEEEKKGERTEHAKLNVW